MRIKERLKRKYEFIYANIAYKISHNIEYIYNYYRKQGIKIGVNCCIYSELKSPEPYLISIGNNVTIAPGVNFICHDNSVCKLSPQYTDVFGCITIGDNCFIGANSLILPGIDIGNNTIIAAGSIVTKSFGGGLVIGGNPAKIITDINAYKTKIEKYALSTNGLSYSEKKQLLLNTNKLIKK